MSSFASPAGWRADDPAGRQRHIRDQQADPQPPALVLFSHQVPPSRVRVAHHVVVVDDGGDDAALQRAEAVRLRGHRGQVARHEGA